MVFKSLDEIDWHKYFYYDPTSPTGLRNTFSRGRAFKGAVAGSFKQSTGYYVLCVEKELYQAQRVLFHMMVSPVGVNDVVDHIDGNKLNNSLDNLRVVPWEINARNTCKRRDNTSSKTGVYKHYNRGNAYYCARVEMLDGSPKQRLFSFSKYGERGAFEKASQFRDEMIKKLNEQNAQYSERHGK